MAKKDPIGITPEFKEDVDKMNVEQKRMSIFNMQAEVSTTNKWMKEDPGVQSAKDSYELAISPAKETLKVLKNRTQYIIDDMKDSGEL